MGVLKRKEEPTETITLRVPASVKAEIDRLRERTSEAGFDLNATHLRIDHSPDATDARRDGCGWRGRPRGETVLESLQKRTDWHIQIGCFPAALLMVRAECEAMRVGVRDGVRSMIELQRFACGRTEGSECCVRSGEEVGERSFVRRAR